MHIAQQYAKKAGALPRFPCRFIWIGVQILPKTGPRHEKNLKSNPPIWKRFRQINRIRMAKHQQIWYISGAKERNYLLGGILYGAICSALLLQHAIDNSLYLSDFLCRVHDAHAQAGDCLLYTSRISLMSARFSS